MNSVVHDCLIAAQQALHARAQLAKRRPYAQVALQPRRIALGPPGLICCGDPECDEAPAWADYLTIAQAEHTAQAYDLALARWTIGRHACLIRQADAGMRTWASAGDYIARLRD